MGTRTPSLHHPPNALPSLQQSASDEIFHLSPFLTLNHLTIAPAYTYTPIGSRTDPATLAPPQVPDDSGTHSSNPSPEPYSGCYDDVPQSVDEDDEGDSSQHDVSSES